MSRVRVRDIINKKNQEHKDDVYFHGQAEKVTLEAANRVHAMLSEIGRELTKEIRGKCYAQAVVSGMSPKKPGEWYLGRNQFNRLVYLWVFERKLFREGRREKLCEFRVDLELIDDVLDIEKLNKDIENFLQVRDNHVERFTYKYISFRDSLR